MTSTKNPQWQPITEAPEDECIILCMSDGNVGEGKFNSFKDSWILFFDQSKVEPVLWQPLPLPPPTEE